MTLLQRIEKLERELRAIKRSSEWMPVEEFCRITGVKKSTAHKYSSAGTFTKSTKGGLKFKREEVMQWLAGEANYKLKAA